MDLKWNAELAIGVSIIDNQHIELFNRFNNLLSAITHGEGRDELIDTIRYLEDYVVTHFQMEEEVMARYSYSYPQASAHKAEHQQFVRDFGSLKEKLKDAGYSTLLAVDVLGKMGDWLLKHVIGTDRELGRFLRVAMTVRKAA